MKHLSHTLLALACLSILVGASGCQTTLPIPGLGGKASDAERVAAVLDHVHKAMEARKTGRVLKYISPDYHDAQGRDFAAIKDYVTHVHSNYREISITRAAPKVEVQDGQARALEAFGTLARPNNPGENPPINVQGQMVVHLREEDSEWKIIEWGVLQ
ncbi:MAG: hypothetical protein ACLFTT_11605 [Candidatus Hydrogenedentota bacterium]